MVSGRLNALAVFVRLDPCECGAGGSGTARPSAMQTEPHLLVIFIDNLRLRLRVAAESAGQRMQRAVRHRGTSNRAERGEVRVPLYRRCGGGAAGCFRADGSSRPGTESNVACSGHRLRATRDSEFEKDVGDVVSHGFL